MQNGEDTTNYEALECVWSKKAADYVKTPKYKFRPGQTVWVWWDHDLKLRKATVIRFLYHEGWYQRWAVTTEMADRSNGIAASNADMYATHEEAVDKCREGLLSGLESVEGRFKRYVKALERLDG